MASHSNRLGWKIWGLIGFLATSMTMAIGQERTRSDVVPEIRSYIRKLKDLDLRVRSTAIEILGKLGDRALASLVEVLDDSRSGELERHGALEALERMGPYGRRAAPVVERILGSKSSEEVYLRVAAARTLGKMGVDDPRVVSALRAALKYPELVVREAAVEALFNLDKGAVDAVPELTLLLKSDDETLRRAAADTLGRIGLPAATAVPNLIAMLGNDPSADVRRSAAVALRSVGPSAAGALEKLISALEYPDDSVQRAAVDTLAVMGPAAISAIPTLQVRLAAGDLSVRRSAAVALGNMGPAAKTSMAILIKALQDADTDLCRNATNAIGRIGPDADAIPALVRVLDRSEPEVKQAAADALYKIGPRAAPAVVKLKRLLVDQDLRVRRSAADTLGEIGPDEARQTFPELSELLLEIEDEHVHCSAAVALGKLGSATEPARQALIRDLKHPSPQVRSAALTALRTIAATPDLVPLFTDLLDDPDGEVRRSAIDDLAHFGPANTPVIGKLRKMLKDATEWEVRRSAANALRVMDATEARGELAEALTDRHWEVRQSAAYALLSMRPGPESSPRLLQALSDGDWIVRRVSSDALAKIDPPPLFELIELLGDERVYVRVGATDALRQMNAKGYLALPALAKRIVLDPEEKVRERAVDAINAICGQLLAGADPKSTKELRQTLGKVEESASVLEDQAARDPQNAEKARRDLEAATSSLNSRIRQRGLQGLVQFSGAHPYISSILLWFVCWAALWLILYHVKPIWVLTASEYLQRVKTPLRIPFTDQEITHTLLRWVTCLGIFEYRDGVLDAWVRHHARVLIGEFENLGTVRKHKVHTPVPVTLEDDSIAIPSEKTLRRVFDHKNWCLVIQGEEHSGKTNLACHLARLLSDEQECRRLRVPRMLPLLVDWEFLDDAGEGHSQAGDAGDSPSKKHLVHRLAGLLKQMTRMDESPSAELVENLLRSCRVLVLVNHYSEMTEPTRRRFQPRDPDFRVNALIITSRVEPEIGVKKTFCTRPLARQELEAFLKAYLAACREDLKFLDEEICTACEEILRQEGGQYVRIGRAKLYADGMVRRKDVEQVRQSDVVANR